MSTVEKTFNENQTCAHKVKGKASFDWIYNQPDPRAYFITLAEQDYELPKHMQYSFGRLVEQWMERNGRAPRIFDIACSYGVLPTLLRYEDTSFMSLARRYATPEFQQMTADEILKADRDYFAERLKPDAPTIYGCDIADEAVRYGERAGLLEKAWAIDLETEIPDEDLDAILARTDIVTVSAAIGYITHRSIESVLSRIPVSRRPWFAAFALRMAPIDPVAHTLREHGLEPATLTGRTVRQRRFVDDHERETAIQAVRDRGLMAEGHEMDGYWHASLYIAHPPDEPPLQMIELFDA